MNKTRMEAFSDGVIAILITIMVLELHIPHGVSLSSLRLLAPVFTSYVLSFVFLGIYWSNHHHLLQAVVHVDGLVLWANLHLLFWLSLVPFGAGWMGENDFAPLSVALYGTILLFAGIAYYLLTRALIALHGRESVLRSAVGRDFKGVASIVVYAVAIPLSFLNAWVGFALYVVVAAIWLIPDRRIANTLARSPSAADEAID
jgi:uncharacterized membrane protein